MSQPNVQIDLNIRLVEQGTYELGYVYGSNAEPTDTPKPAAQAGLPIQVGSSMIARGLSVPLGD
jgi:hypothetical protein